MKKRAYIVMSYAAAVLSGGLLGAFIAGSIPSLIAGVVFGSLIFLNGYKMYKEDARGQQLAMIQAIILGSFFVYRYQMTQKPMPAFPMIALSFGLALYLMITLPKKKKAEK